MPPNRLFIDPESNDLELDLDRLLFEAKPIALILLVFGGAGVGFFVFARLFQYVPLFPQLFLFAQQFAFALGGFVALLYVLVRAMQFADGVEVDLGSTPPPSAEAHPDGERSRHEIPVRNDSRPSNDDRTPSTKTDEEVPSDTIETDDDSESDVDVDSDAEADVSPDGDVDDRQ